MLLLLATLMVFTPPLLVEATSVKMDFLSAGLVRTDPLMYSQIGECLSDHVHRFYGAVSNKTMRPEVSYEDLRNADGNSGNTEENLSLYWNPAIYKVKNQYSEEKTYEIVDVWFASAYYVWHTGKTFAFPRGLKMRALGKNKQSRAVRVCDGAFDCEREDEDGCEGYRPSQQVERRGLKIILTSNFFPLIRQSMASFLSRLAEVRSKSLYNIFSSCSNRAGNQHQVPDLLGRGER